MRMYPVISSQVHSVGYDPTTYELRIRFHGRGKPHPLPGSGVTDSTYHYLNVTPTMWNEIRSAQSVGQYVNRAIKKFPEAYPYRRLTDAEIAGDTYEGEREEEMREEEERITE